jgi:hypothetical protein
LGDSRHVSKRKPRAKRMRKTDSTGHNNDGIDEKELLSA